MSGSESKLPLRRSRPRDLCVRPGDWSGSDGPGPEQKNISVILDNHRVQLMLLSYYWCLKLILACCSLHIISSTRGSLGNKAGFSTLWAQSASLKHDMLRCRRREAEEPNMPVTWMRSSVVSIWWIWNYILWKHDETWEFVLYLAPVSWRSLMDVDGSSLQTCWNKDMR